MSFKYSVVCDTLSFVGHDFLAEPREMLRAIKDAGYEGANLPGNPQKMQPETLKPMVEAAGLEVPELLGAWAYFHGGEDRDMAGNNEEARARGIAYARESMRPVIDRQFEFEDAHVAYRHMRGAAHFGKIVIGV